MDSTHHLKLPYLAAAQAQKHVTHNEALRGLDQIIHISVRDRNLNQPPGAPAEGDRYLVATGATAAWAGHDGALAAFQDGAWAFHTPQTGWIAWIEDEGIATIFVSGTWTPLGSGGGGSVNPAPLVGVNATADTVNRLTVKSDAVLHSHDDATPGSGDVRHVLNKNAPANTASVAFQTGFSGRAEFGLTGDDNWHVKVSPDGSTWHEALIVDRNTGAVSLPATALVSRPNMLINGDFAINQRQFAFGALANGVYGVDRWKASGATDIGWVAATLTLTLNAGGISQVIEPDMWGRASFASSTVTVSVEDLTNGSLNVQFGSASGVITAGVGRRSVTLTTGPGDTGPLPLTLSAASYPVWFKRVKLEQGVGASEWIARASGDELRLCQRYFAKSFPLNERPRNAAGSAAMPARAGFSIGATLLDSEWVEYPVEMRAEPAVTLFNFLTTGNRWCYFRTGVGWVDSTSSIIVNQGRLGCVVRQSTTGLNDANGFIVRGGFTADAEL